MEISKQFTWWLKLPTSFEEDVQDKSGSFSYNFQWPKFKTKGPLQYHTLYVSPPPVPISKNDGAISVKKFTWKSQVKFMSCVKGLVSGNSKCQFATLKGHLTIDKGHQQNWIASDSTHFCRDHFTSQFQLMVEPTHLKNIHRIGGFGMKRINYLKLPASFVRYPPWN